MIKSLSNVLSLYFLILLSAISVQARQAEVYDYADPQMILNFARGEGRADLLQEQGKDPMIKGKINGLAYSLFFIRCEKNQQCKGLEFLVRLPSKTKKTHELEVINQFNRDYTAATAYVDKQTLYITRSLSFSGGLTEANIDNFIQTNTQIVDVIQSGKFN